MSFSTLHKKNQKYNTESTAVIFYLDSFSFGLGELDGLFVLFLFLVLYFGGVLSLIFLILSLLNVINNFCVGNLIVYHFNDTVE